MITSIAAAMVASEPCSPIQASIGSKAISSPRAGLDDEQRRRLNRPGAVWSHWQRSIKATTTAPKRQHVVKGTTSHKSGRPVYWSREMLRRAATALRECRSNDIFKMARAALEGAIRTDADLLELLNDAPVRQIKAPVAAVTHAAA
jgi:hypothetical protein